MVDWGKVLNGIPIETILILVGLLIFVSIIKSNWFKGKLGEVFVNGINKLSLDKNIYKNIKDVIIKLKDGSTTQIDHIIVSKYGIFVIETKNYKGWIFGNEKSKNWTVTNYKKKNQFQNPIHQNYKHIKALEEILKLDIKSFVSIVAFMGECTFKTDMPDNVFQGNQYIKYIKSFDKAIFNPGQVNIIIKDIERKRLKRGFKTDREHVKTLRK